MRVAERKASAPTLRRGNPEEVGMSRSQLHHVGELAQSWVDQGLIQCLVALVARHVVTLSRLRDVDEVMTHARALFERRLRRSHVHAAVDLS